MSESFTLRDYAAANAARLEEAIRTDLELTLRDADPLLGEVLHYSLLGGGKRMRPLLATLCARLCGRDDAGLQKLAVGLEYLHVATLIHDDVIDHAELRRGRRSVVARYGLPAAILAGDWLHARSMHLVGQTTGAAGLEIFCAATAAMVDGEFLQLRHAGDAALSEEQYYRIIHCKTAGLVRCTCALAALYADADQKEQEALAEYGHLLGTAFQVVDDLLDYQGSTATGKALGNDFREGKLTLPLLHALGNATPEQRGQLRDLLAGERDDAATLQRVQTLIRETGGFDSARRTAEQLIDRARGRLALFPPSEETTLLSELGAYILVRSR